MKSTAGKSNNSKYRCPACDTRAMSVFFKMDQVPVHCNVLLPSREEALHYPRGDIHLGYCENCGFIYNVAFAPDLIEYSSCYENSLINSPRFRAYLEGLASRLIERHRLYGKTIIEIGCGDGEFLKLLCERGGNKGIGFDPSHEAIDNGHQIPNRVDFIQDYYSDLYAQYQGELICCRQTLEHIQSPTDLLSVVRLSIEDHCRSAVFFEVPNVDFIINALSIWDIIYEHCSYFSSESLARLFRKCGFEILDLREEFDRQYISIEALPSDRSRFKHSADEDDLLEMNQQVIAFGTAFRNIIHKWSHRLDEARSKGLRYVIWGAGSKGVMFLNLLNTDGVIEYAIDVNPQKQNMHIPCTGQKIVSPEFLQKYQPDMILLMNPIYRQEIQRQLEDMCIETELFAV